MRKNLNIIVAYSIMMGLILLVGIFQSWNVALSIFNLCLISAVMTMGANVQWGYAGLINFGLMGYAALGGLAAVLISVDPVQEAWRAGGFDILMCLWLIIVMIMAIRFILKNFEKSKYRTYGIAAIIIAGIIIIRVTAEPGIEAIEAINPAKTGFLGGFGLPIMFSWIIGAFFAGGLAFVVGKVALGLRADYLAIATLLISEIVIAIIKHEDWLSRGVKNVIGLDRPVPYEVNLQTTDWFINLVAKFNSSKLELISNMADRQTALNQLVIEGSSVFVKLCYSGLFLTVVIALLIVTQKALYSPWGRMMRAIRDNEEAANAMGKNVVKQHLLIFILGSAIVGIAGAMLVTQDGLFTPGSYRPMRYTFLIWVMVIVGGSGNNFGAILGGFAVWFLWIEAAPIALFLINLFTSGMPDTHALKVHLIESVPYFRYLMMGLGLLLIMRYRPKGILPEKIEIK
ncbi:branched-chain amino acid ABC transporter permease [Candidatus Pelagibacter sp.]|uniref:branched-chain amino acid ABC transporter permease n=1 Tax=uncultured Candidatus Pelagibacter sp. TaxID=372654 RepID=UPI00231483EA|nr:branched-chain amino acid ABC transporter permease [uncultured Candidatus Pelagibacter sp.]MDA7587852.1 branched-chain amino acid ABC transporter permease [Candidatus Pelagibacter sp.]MDB3970047.1 branched-chain amino acid ABC transporter permease [Candidatus Pelagibacter sp.]MDC0428183.1 branched-chain amino acid ABC transporter permease [Candidatus Pelagibacter sp.]